MLQSRQLGCAGYTQAGGLGRLGVLAEAARGRLELGVPVMTCVAGRSGDGGVDD